MKMNVSLRQGTMPVHVRALLSDFDVQRASGYRFWRGFILGVASGLALASGLSTILFGSLLAG